MAGRIDGRFMSAGLAGQADLYGFFKGGFAIEIELKAARGKARDAQIVWASFCKMWSIPHLPLRGLRGEDPEATVARWIETIKSVRP